ncbi:MAG: threonine-phosphate decarboxylase CobD [Pseudomonadota bacterium]
MTATPIAEGAHGGNLDWAAREFGGQATDWLDLSTGINPWPYAFDPPPAADWARLPGEAGLSRLRRAAARYYGAGPSASVVPAPGSQALIQQLPGLRPGARVAIVGRLSYSEHATSWRNAGNDVATGLTLAEAVASADVVVVTNPNNPDAGTCAADELRAAHRELARRGGLLVVDEAFADVVPGQSVAGDAGVNGLVVLKSFGKFFGLAGLRLGFALTSGTDRAQLERAVGPWPVSGPALSIGCQALADSAWQQSTRTRLDGAMTSFAAALKAATAGEPDIRVVGKTPLFLLLEHADAEAIWRTAAHQHILLRRFAERPTWLRIGVPPDPDCEQRLVGLLTERPSTTAC